MPPPNTYHDKEKCEPVAMVDKLNPLKNNPTLIRYHRKAL